jgi:hypothetical protein
LAQTGSCSTDNPDWNKLAAHYDAAPLGSKLSDILKTAMAIFVNAVFKLTHGYIKEI